MSEAIKKALNNLNNGELGKFIGNNQKIVLRKLLHGEEREGFAENLNGLAERIATMPVTYQQDGKGEDAIVYLHYFRGNMDWHITEKDKDGGVEQAFGLANIGYGGELGYISIEELTENNVEIDLYWKPKTLGECRKD